MALGGKHTLPGFERSLEQLRTDILLMATLVLRSLNNAKKGFVHKTKTVLCSHCRRREGWILGSSGPGWNKRLVRFNRLPLIFAPSWPPLAVLLLEYLRSGGDNRAAHPHTDSERTLEEDDRMTRIFEQVDDSFAEALGLFFFDCSGPASPPDGTAQRARIDGEIYDTVGAIRNVRA
jgi:hypothetical protein